MDLQISGKTALVTSATEGIGRAIATALARQGVRVAVTGPRKTQLAELARELVAAGAQEPALVVGDLLDADAPARFAAEAAAALGPVDILVNNALGSRPLGIAASDEAWDEAFVLHFTRHRQLAQRVLACMIERGWGRVLSVTGASATEGINGACCAKAALHAWSKALAREVAAHGVTVNCVAPHRSDDEEAVADLVCYLASPLAASVSGAVIPVDRGLRRHRS